MFSPTPLLFLFISLSKKIVGNKIKKETTLLGWFQFPRLLIRGISVKLLKHLGIHLLNLHTYIFAGLVAQRS